MPTRSLLELILLAALWGASFLFLRVAAPEFGPVVLIAIRVCIASLLLLPIWWLRERHTARQAVMDNWPHLLRVGLLNSAVPFVLFAYATLFITGGMASVINATAPIWAALIAFLWLGQRPSTAAIIGMILGVSGVAILVSGSLGTGHEGVAVGILAALAATLLYGMAVNYTTVYLHRVSALTIATFSLVAASCILLLPAVFMLPPQPVSAQAWLAVLAMGVFSTGLANILYFRLISDIGPTRAITVTFLIPLFGTLFGVLFLQEVVSPSMIVGAIVILAGTALVTGVISAWNRQRGNA